MFANIINITATKRDWKRAGSVKSPKGTNAIASGETRRNSDTIVAVPEGDERAAGPFQGGINQHQPFVGLHPTLLHPSLSATRYHNVNPHLPQNLMCGGYAVLHRRQSRSAWGGIDCGLRKPVG